MINRRIKKRAINHSENNSSGQERWIVSYADFMTLLMAFFVVMYSISSVSEKKYQVLSNTLSGAFNKIIENEKLIADKKTNQVDIVETLPNISHVISQKLDESFQSLINNDLISVSGSENWLQIELQSAILFDVGGAILHISAEEIIGQISTIMHQYSNVIRVEGFTDNTPIKNSIFASNWELSTARATAVVRFMESQGINPNRLAAVGYGEHQPVASNSTNEGKSKNRRIILMISTLDELRPSFNENPVTSFKKNPLMPLT